MRIVKKSQLRKPLHKLVLLSAMGGFLVLNGLSFKTVKAGTSSKKHTAMEKTYGSSIKNTIKNKAEELKRKIVHLENLIKKREKNKINVSYEKVTLSVGKLFLGFALCDADHIEYNAKLFASWGYGKRNGLMNKKKALQEASYLPIYELSRTIEIVDQAITDIKDINHLKRRICPQFEMGTDVHNLEIKNGYFYLKNKPIFLNGFNLTVSKSQWDEAHSIGANMATVKLELTKLIKSNKATNYQYLNNKRKEIEYLRNLNVIPMIRIKHEFPEWLYIKYPDLHHAKGHFIDYDIDHPKTKMILKESLKKVIPKISDFPCVFYKIGNELSWPVPHQKKPKNTQYFSKYAYNKFKIWLKEKHKSIESLNALWGTNFANFNNIVTINNHMIDYHNKPLWYDICNFNQKRITQFFRFLYNEIKRHDNDATVYVNTVNEKIFMGTLSRKTFKKGMRSSVSHHINGVDIEALVDLLDLKGFDTRALPTPPFNIHHPWYDHEKYSFHWLGLAMAYDFHRSISPNKPLFETEFHNVQTTVNHNPNIPADHMMATLWLAHLQGVALNNIWHWQRKKNRLQKGTNQHAGLFTQPQLVNAYARTMLEVNSFAEEIVALNKLPKKINIFYSESSAIHEVKYLDLQQAAYEALFFLGLPIGFVTEKMVQNGKLRDCGLFIIPSNNYVDRHTIKEIEKYYNNGGKIIIIGKEVLEHDKYGRKYEPSVFSFLSDVPKIYPKNAEQIQIRLENYIKWFNLANNIRCYRKDTNNSYGIYSRSLKLENDYIIFIINVSRDELEVEIKLNNRNIEKATDMRRNIKQNIKSIILKPKDVKVYKLPPVKLG